MLLERRASLLWLSVLGAISDLSVLNFCLRLCSDCLLGGALDGTACSWPRQVREVPVRIGGFVKEAVLGLDAAVGALPPRLQHLVAGFLYCTVFPDAPGPCSLPGFFQVFLGFLQLLPGA